MQAVLVLIATYNGERYLREQLDSILRQSHQEVYLAALDDASSDGTLDILLKYEQLYPERFVHLNQSDRNQGHLKTFSRLLQIAEESNFDYFMLADQDDMWFPTKVEDTLSEILVHEQNKTSAASAVLIHTDLEVVDQNLKKSTGSFIKGQNLNPKQKRPLSNLLVQNYVTGCTTGFNRRLLQNALPMPDKAIIHDWWLGLVAETTGKLIYIDRMTMLYRQHDNNAVGASLSSQTTLTLSRFKLLRDKAKKVSIQARQLQDHINSKNIPLHQDLHNFNAALKGSPLTRSYQLAKLSIRRNSLIGTLLLYFFFFWGQ